LGDSGGNDNDLIQILKNADDVMYGLKKHGYQVKYKRYDEVTRYEFNKIKNAEYESAQTKGGN